MKPFIILTALYFFPLYIFSQVTADDCHTSTEGTDFWFGFMEGRDLKNIHFLEIVVTAREATTFSITYGPDETVFESSMQVNSGAPTKVTIPWELVEHFTSEVIEDKGIHLTSEKPVSVYALNWDQNSNDAAVLYPTKSLGTEYYAMCYTPSQYPTDNGKNTEFLIVATEDTTLVKISPSVNTHDNIHLKGETYEITLHKGQSYQVQSLNNNNWSGQGDLTGSYILSDKPIALFSGSLIAMIPPADPQFGTGDHLFEQIPPVHAWGREFLTVPFKTRYWDLLRIMAKEDHTIVWINGLKPDTLNRGEYRDTVLLHYQPRRIISEKPVLVAQYSQSAIEDMGVFAGGNNEPFMIILSPVVQFRNSVNFALYPAQQYANYYLNAIFPDSQRPKMYLDGVKLEEVKDSDGNSIFHQHANNYSFIQYHFDSIAQNKTHNLWCSDPKGGFYSYSYSYGLQESFGYGVAFNLDNLLDLGSSINFQQDTLLLCYGDSLTLDAGWWFNKFLWSTGDTSQTIKASDRGWYSVEVEDIKGCPQTDSVYIYLSKPVTDLGIDYDEGCQPYPLQLDAGDGFKKYYWSTGERTQKIIADTSGIYSVTVQNKYGCQASDSMKLTVFPTPKISLLSDYTICDTLKAEIKVDLSYFNSQPWDLPLQTKWYAEDTNVLLTDTSQTSIKISAPDWGNYKISYNAVTENGCDTTRNFEIRFSQTPSSDFEILDETGGCSDFSREVRYIGESFSNELHFEWDFGSSQIVETLGWQDYRISLALDEDPFISLIVEKNGCFSQPDSLPFVILKDLNIDVNQDVGCDMLYAYFSSGSTMNNVNYFWNFGDGNQSTDSNPSNLYLKPGFYDVDFTVQSRIDSICKASYTFKKMIKVYSKPTANFTGQQNECYIDSITIQYTDAKDTTFYKWYINNNLVYSGYGIEELTIPLVSPFTYVKLEVNEYVCQSAPVTKRFIRRPKADFSLDIAEGCEPLNVKATGISEDEGLVYTWLKNHQQIERGNSYTYLLDEPAKYSLGIIVYSSETGCRDTIQKENIVWVHPNPTAKFNVDQPVVYNDKSPISFNNLSQNGSDYYWNFDDGNYSEEINPQNIYEEIGIYHPQLTTINIFGCQDSASTEIQVLPFAIHAPNAFRPDSEIPENRYFMPAGEGIEPDKFNMKIFDRWGQLVFESFHFSDKWDGNALNGKPAQMGNYVWIASYYDILGSKHKMKGQVLLVR